MGRVLLVDDEPNIRRILAFNLRRDQHQIYEAGGVEEAQRILASRDFDVVITDQKMPDGNGLAALSSAHESDPTVAVIFLTASVSTELAAKSIRRGAFHFLSKPFEPESARPCASPANERCASATAWSISENPIGRRGRRASRPLNAGRGSKSTWPGEEMKIPQPGVGETE